MAEHLNDAEIAAEARRRAKAARRQAKADRAAKFAWGADDIVINNPED